MSSQLTQTPRLEVADIARGIAILLVVFAHSLEIFMARPGAGSTLFTLWKGIYSFHLPFFFLISGYLSKVHSSKHGVRSALTLILFSFLADGPAWLIKHQMGFEKSFPDYFNDIILLKGFTLIVTWFLPALGLVRILDHLLHARHIALRGISLSLLIGGFWWHQTSYSNAFQIGSLLPGILLFEWGRWFKTSSWIPNAHPHPLMGLVLGVGMISLAFWLDRHNQGCLFNPDDWCLNIGDSSLVGRLGPQNAVFMMFGDIGFFPFFLITAALGSLGILSLSLSVQSLRVFAIPLKTIGKKTLPLLILNGYFLSLIEIPYLKPFEGFEEISWETGLLLSLIITLVHLILLPIAETLFRPLIQRAGALSNFLVTFPFYRKSADLK